MLFKFPGSVKSACVQKTIFILNFLNLKRKASNVIFNLTIYFTNTVVEQCLTNLCVISSTRTAENY